MKRLIKKQVIEKRLIKQSLFDGFLHKKIKKLLTDNQTLNFTANISISAVVEKTSEQVYQQNISCDVNVDINSFDKKGYLYCNVDIQGKNNPYKGLKLFYDLRVNNIYDVVKNDEKDLYQYIVNEFNNAEPMITLEGYVFDIDQKDVIFNNVTIEQVTIS